MPDDEEKLEGARDKEAQFKYVRSRTHLGTSRTWPRYARMARIRKSMVGALILGCSMLTFSTGGLAEVPQGNLGTLSCLAGLPAANERQRSLDCTFKPVGGYTARFRGEIAQVGASPHVVTKRVLVWQVYGPAGLEPGDLAGTFVRRDPPIETKPRRLENALVGGNGDTIALQPPTGREQIPGNDAVTVLELRLEALKT